MRVQRLHNPEPYVHNTVRIYFLHVTLIYNVYEVVEFSLLRLIEATNWSLDHASQPQTCGKYGGNTIGI
jgi:hypothetical protein